MTPAEDKIINDYLLQGFHRVVVRRDEPNFLYPNHYHAYTLVLQVMTGMLDVFINHKHTFVRPGDHVQILSGQFHTVHIGPEGCSYIHAEK